MAINYWFSKLSYPTYRLNVEQSALVTLQTHATNAQIYGDGTR